MTNMSLDRFKITSKILNDGGVPCYSFPTTAAKALGALYKYSKIRTRVIGEPKSFNDIDLQKAAAIIKEAKTSGKQFLSSESVYSLLAAYGIPTASWKIVDDVNAVATADAIGYPVVVKAESEKVIHKSDVGGVAVNLKNADEVRKAVEKMKASIDVSDLKFLVQKFISGGKELIAGVSTKPRLGHLIMFGIGGIYVEVLKDVVFKIAPVTEVEAKEMLSSIKMSKLLDGVRGEKGINKDMVIDIIQRISKLVTDFPMIAEMDMNPIIAINDKVYVVDARMKID